MSPMLFFNTQISVIIEHHIYHWVELQSIYIITLQERIPLGLTFAYVFEQMPVNTRKVLMKCPVIRGFSCQEGASEVSCRAASHAFNISFFFCFLKSEVAAECWLVSIGNIVVSI